MNRGGDDDELWEAFGGLAIFGAFAVSRGCMVARSLYTWSRCRRGSLVIPAQLELTDRALVGFFSEPEFAPTRCVDIELDSIEKLWFMTARRLRGRGQVRKKVRWADRYDPFGVLSDDQRLRGLRIRAAGRTYVLLLERLGGGGGGDDNNNDDDDSRIRELCAALHLVVRDRLFPPD